MNHALTTQKEVRGSFWQNHPERESYARRRKTLSKGQNAQTCDTRQAFCDFVESLYRSGEISEALADRVTL